MQYAHEILKAIVMKLLVARKMHGYEITQAAKAWNNGQLQLTEGALYPALHVLEKQGLLKTEIIYTGRRTRKYYMLNTGKIKITEKEDRLKNLINNAIFFTAVKSLAT